MTGLPARLLRQLFGDPRSRRALDETIVDVRAEFDEAPHPLRRLRWAIRSAIAILRVSVRVVPFELKAVASGGWPLRLTAWTMLLVSAIALQPVAQTIQFADVPGRTRLFLCLTLLPQALAVAVPVASFLAAVWSRRPAVSAVLPAVMAAALTWLAIHVTPATNQAYRTIAFAALGGTPAPGTPARGLRELTLSELARAAVATPSRSSRTPAEARRQILLRAGLVTVAGTFTLLGGFLARRAWLDSTRRRRLWPYAIGMPALAHAFGAVFSGAGYLLASAIALALAVYVGVDRAPVGVGPDRPVQP